MSTPRPLCSRPGVVTALLVVVLAASVAAAGCGRAAPRVSSVVRTEGDRVLTTTLSYDDEGHPATVERLEGDEEDPRDVATLTWDEGLLTQIVRIVSFDGFSLVTTTDITYDGEQPVGAVANTVRVRDDAEDGDEPDDVSEETFTVTYDRALVETVERRFEDDDRNRSSTLLTFAYDVTGIVSVAEETSEENNGNGLPDVEVSRLTAIEYAEGRPAKLSIAEDEGRPLVMDIAYDGGALDEVALAIPALDDANNEFIADGKIVYEKDADDRIDVVTFESDVAETVQIEIAYEDVEEDASGVDTMPAGVVALPLWDLRGAAYDTIDARTQIVRMLGASW